MRAWRHCHALSRTGAMSSIGWYLAGPQKQRGSWNEPEAPVNSARNRAILLIALSAPGASVFVPCDHRLARNQSCLALSCRRPLLCVYVWYTTLGKSETPAQLVFSVGSLHPWPLSQRARGRIGASP